MKKGFTFLASKKAKLLLQFSSNGFSLIEILVAVSIIAILATIGYSVFTTAQNRSKDARRRADINAIAKAYEDKLDSLKGEYYPLLHIDFASGSMPVPPEGGAYIHTEGPISGRNCLENNTRFKVCAKMSNTPSNSDCSNDATCYCISSSQNYTDSCTPALIYPDPPIDAQYISPESYPYPYPYPDPYPTPLEGGGEGGG